MGNGTSDVSQVPPNYQTDSDEDDNNGSDDHLPQVIMPPPQLQFQADPQAGPRRRVGALDPRGVERGECTKCSHCAGYAPGLGAGGGSWRCASCDCVPVVHKKISDADVGTEGAKGPTQKQAWTVPRPANDSAVSVSHHLQCRYPGCQERLAFDANTGHLLEHFCSAHVNHGTLQAMTCEADLVIEDVEPLADQQYTYTADTSVHSTQQPIQPAAGSHAPSTSKCAIAECPNPCYVDSSGKVHNCCGYSHAMEYQRRLAIQQQNQVIKGITHCLLSECSNLVWPFKNYCSKSHADIGMQRGLIPPSPAGHGPQAGVEKDKDSSLCILPGCRKPKYIEGGTTFDFCGRSHAQLGKQQGITSSAEKEEDQCELPGCQRSKRQEGTRVHDYCCRDHANQDAPNRDARILTSMSDVKKFLDGYKGQLTVVDMKENDSAKPGGELYRRYKAKWESLPKHQRKTCLAFHGSSESNIDSICKNGYDKSKRGSNVGQALGAGEYFATDPSTSLGYCRGKKIILNELLLGQQGTHHTQSGNIIVMKYPDHDLPRFVITFS